MHFVYCDIAEILPKAKIWCPSRGNDEQSTYRIAFEVEAVFFSIPSQCKPHASLNTSRGIIECPDLAGISIEDITEGLADQHVTNARRTTVTRDGVKRETNTIILTFQTAIIPKIWKVGYLKVPIDLYVPNPLQC